MSDEYGWYRFLKKILIRIVVLGVIVVVLAQVGLILLTKQPGAPTAEFSAPQGRDEAWRQDIAFLRDEFLKVDRSFTEDASQEFLGLLNDVYEQVPSLSDNEIVVEITRAAAVSGNGHTRAYLMRNGNYLERLPIRYYWFSDGLYVIRATEDFSQTLGARVLAINGIAPEELMSQMRELIPGSDTWAVYKSTYLLNSPEFLNGLNVVPSADSVRITFENPDGARFTLYIRPLPLDERDTPYEAWRDLSPLSLGNEDGRPWLHVLSDRELPLYLQQPNRACNYEFLQSANVLFIQINRNSSDETCSQSDFAEDIKKLADTISPNSVILDLRFNTGGSNEETKKISKGLPVWFGSAKRIYIVTGPATFSAGIVTAARLKYFSGERAVVVGEPAGEGLRMWSEGPRFTLPNSKLQVKAATAFHDFAEADFELGKTYFMDLFLAVPAGDIAVDKTVTTSFQDYLSGHDPVLETVFSH
jgi:hypothetical protein